MGRWRTSTEQWLLSEQQDLDDAADAAFAQAFAALPNVEPSAGFVQRATEAAWLARERQRRIVGLGATSRGSKRQRDCRRRCQYCPRSREGSPHGHHVSRAPSGPWSRSQANRAAIRSATARMPAAFG